MNVIEAQHQRQQTAARILDTLDLERLWSRFGRPTLVGAMSYDLMVAPDIDMEIFHNGAPPIDQGFEVMAACARHQMVREVRFSNHLDGADEGIYWQLRVAAGDEDWKIDMWLLREGHPGPLSSWLTEPMRAALTDETRRAILTIKQAEAGNPDRCGSIHIYRAVLQDGVRTPDEFRRWQGRHDTTALTDWLPSPARPGSR